MIIINNYLLIQLSNVLCFFLLAACLDIWFLIAFIELMCLNSKDFQADFEYKKVQFLKISILLLYTNIDHISNK